jgi:hypothetical protein
MIGNEQKKQFLQRTRDILQHYNDTKQTNVQEMIELGMEPRQNEHGNISLWAGYYKVYLRKEDQKLLRWRVKK